MKRIIFITAIALALLVNLSAQDSFKASKDARNQVTFESDAPLENIVGVSNNLEAMTMINRDNITENPKGKVKVDLSTLKTGIDLRDEHMNSKDWLYTEKYPSAEFKLNGIKNASSNKLYDGKKVKATLLGTLTIHGKTKNVEVPTELTYYKETAKTKGKIAGNLLKAKSVFNIKLSDYGISIPSMVVGKLDENIKLTANFIASDAGGMHADNPCGGCNPCGAKMGDKCNPCSAKKMAKCNPCGVKK